MTYDWDKHWERVSDAFTAEFGVPWLNIPPTSEPVIFPIPDDEE